MTAGISRRETCRLLLHALQIARKHSLESASLQAARAWRELVKQLARALNLEWNANLVSGVTMILVVAQPRELMRGAAIRTRSQESHALGEAYVRHHWLEDNYQRC